MGIGRGTTAIHDPPLGVFLDPPLTTPLMMIHYDEHLAVGISAYVTSVKL